MHDQDDSFLDDLFEVALETLARGEELDVTRIVAGRPDLRRETEEVLRVARDVSAFQPSELPKIPGYAIVREIGRGAMGTVYLARQEKAGERLVALKVLPGAAASSKQARARFLAESRSLARLRHPHVVVVHDVIEAKGVLAYAMEWIDGATLAQVLEGLRNDGGVPDPSLFARALGADTPPEGAENLALFFCRVAISIARALGEVHRAGLLHRDVKPSNILVRKDGTALLSDFGLARDPSSAALTQSGAFMGTPAYAAPEQLRGDRSIDARTDVYALGVTLYEALAGRRPFDAERVAPLALLKKVESGGFPPLRRVDSTLPRDLETIVHKAIDADPERRYATADALADDLDRLLNLQPIAARPAGPITRCLRFSQRNRRSIVLAIAGGVLGVLLAALAFDHAARQEEADRNARTLRSDAWLRLLRPAEGERMFQAARGPVGEGVVPIDTEALDAALELYREAIEVGPSSALASDLETERAAVMVARDGSAIDTAADISRSSRVERRNLGLSAFLRGEIEFARRAWSGIDLENTPDPLVDAAFGELYLALDQPARALPRLLSARNALPDCGFLWVDVADAAVRSREFDLAARNLEVARTKGLLDPFETLERVESDLLAATGKTAEARGRYESFLKRHAAPTARLHYARLLDDQGDTEAAIAALTVLVLQREGIAEYREELRAMAELWWAGRDERLRQEDLRAFLAYPFAAGPGGIAWAQLFRAVRRNRDSSHSDPDSSAFGSGTQSLADVAGNAELFETETETMNSLPLSLQSFVARTWIYGWPRAGRGLARVSAKGVAAVAIVASALIPTAVARASGHVLFQHAGSVDPKVEGWSQSGPGAGVSAGPCSVPGFDAWCVSDNSSVSGSGIAYSMSPTVCEAAKAAALGWTLRGCIQMSATGATESIYALYDPGNGANRFDMWFSVNASGNPVVKLATGGTGCIAITGSTFASVGAGSCGALGFHLFELTFNPSSQTADLRVDGSVALSSYHGAPNFGSSQPLVAFGAGSSCGQGTGAFHLVEFEVNAPGCSSASTYGHGCPGSGGFVPQLSLNGCIAPCGKVSLNLTNGLGGSTAIVFLGLSQAAAPLGFGCTLNVQPLLPVFIQVTLAGAGGGNGSFDSPAEIPLATATNTTVTLQGFVLDPGVVSGFSSTNGISLTIP